jgi:hypothetical protein
MKGLPACKRAVLGLVLIRGFPAIASAQKKEGFFVSLWGK